jgi:hypothetical protein
MSQSKNMQKKFPRKGTYTYSLENKRYNTILGLTFEVFFYKGIPLANIKYDF